MRIRFLKMGTVASWAVCIIAATLVLLQPLNSLAEETTTAPVKSFALEGVGSEVPLMSDIGSRFAKGFLYCVGGLLLGLSLYKRWATHTEQSLPGSINIIARRGIGPKTSLLVVQTEGQKFFLASTDGDVKLLAPIEEQFSFHEKFGDMSLTTADPEKTLLQVGTV